MTAKRSSRTLPAVHLSTSAERVLLGSFFVFLLGGVIAVAGFWAWSRFPLSGQTGFHDARVAFSYNRTTTKLTVATAPVTQVLLPEELAASASVCPIPHDADYYRQLLQRFPSTAQAITYSFRAKNRPDGWSMTVIPNSPKYSDRPEFSYDFDSCGGGGVGKPERVSTTSAVFAVDCSSLSALPSEQSCLALSHDVLSSLTLR